MFALLPVWPLAAYQKQQPIGVILGADGGRLLPFGTKTPLRAQPGVFLFEGDKIFTAGGSVRLLWCPEGSSRKFEYTLQRDLDLTLDRNPLPVAGGKALDLCLLPAVERNPEVATVPGYREMLPAPLPAGTVDEHLAELPPDTAAALQSLRRSDLADPRLRLAYAVSLANAGLNEESVEQYLELAKIWPDQPRLPRIILDLLQGSASTREIVHPRDNTAAPAKGKTYALVIGIAKYEQDGIRNLLFADTDATRFAAFLASPRGGNAEVVALINKDARVAEIRNRMTALFAKMRKDDTFVIYVAGHGDMPNGVPIVLTYRASAQEPSINALPLAEIQKLRHGEKEPFREVRVFLDVCHAGQIALLDTPPPKGRPAAAPPPKSFFCLTATHQGPDAYAYEDRIFGHGVFTYFLLRGLNTGEARFDDRSITAGSLSTFVEKWVTAATNGLQKPTSLLGVTLGSEIADASSPGIEFNDTRALDSLRIPRERLGKLRRQARIVKQGGDDATPPVSSDPSDIARRISLEDQGELVLLRYLEGDEKPQEAGDFRRGAALFGEALDLQKGSPYLEARKDFCEGRVLVFEKRYDQAVGLLERAIRLDPSAAFTYNALGIAYLEKGDYPMAKVGFEDAIQRAPKWAYPRHNLALVHMQAGNHEGAVAAYSAAKQLAPQYSYLPYNLGLLYHRMNRLVEAEAEYLLARQIAPERSEPHTALGLLKTSQRKWREAEVSFRTALTKPAAVLSRQTANHNLALLLARKPSGWPEAERLWRDNGAYLPSQLAFAEALANRRQAKDAMRVYREILRAVPDHLAARLQLADLLERAGDHDTALGELRTAQSLQADNPLILERLAGVFIAMGQHAEARQFYQSALASTAESAVRSRISKALKRLERAH